MTLELNKHAARGAVSNHKQIALAGFVVHLGQVFDLDVDEPRFVAFEGLMWQCRLF